MNKVLITGASGMLGRALMKSFSGFHVTGTGLTRCRDGLVRLDLRDDLAVRELVSDLRPEIIIHAAAERRPDVSQQDPEGTLALNVHATANLARIAKEFGAWVLFLSTDYVFDGTTPPYSPADATNPLNFYGRTKLEGEQSLWKISMDAGVLRVGVLYGHVEFPDESAVTSVLKDVRSQDSVLVDNWGQRYPTLVDNVAIICRQLSERRLAQGKLSGIWHWCGDECLTKYEMAKIMAELLDLPANHLIPDPNPPKGAPRPKNCQLDCSLLESMEIGERTPFRKALVSILEDWR